MSSYEKLNALLKERGPGWDRKAVAIVIDDLYGNHEAFVRSYLPMMKKRADDAAARRKILAPAAVAVYVIAALLVTTSLTEAGTRCRTSRSGSVTYTTCESPKGKTECRSSRTGSTTYTSCQDR